jgi:hypothetical protein
VTSGRTSQAAARRRRQASGAGAAADLFGEVLHRSTDAAWHGLLGVAGGLLVTCLAPR